MNQAHLKIVGQGDIEAGRKRIGRMALREGKHLYLENLSILMVIEPTEMINNFRKGLEDAFNNNLKQDPKDINSCVYICILTIFEDVTIISGKNPDGMGIKWVNTKTVIPTKRKEYFYGANSPVLKRIYDEDMKRGKERHITSDILWTGKSIRVFRKGRKRLNFLGPLLIPSVR